MKAPDCMPAMPYTDIFLSFPRLPIVKGVARFQAVGVIQVTGACALPAPNNRQKNMVGRNFMLGLKIQNRDYGTVF